MRADATIAEQIKKAQENPTAEITNPNEKAPTPVPALKAAFQSVLPSPYSDFETRPIIRMRVAFWSSPNPAPKRTAPNNRITPPNGRQTVPMAQAMRPGASRRRGSLRSPNLPAHQRLAVVVMPTTRSALAAEKTPDSVTARGRKVKTTPAAIVVAANRMKMRRRGARPSPAKKPAPPSSPSLLDGAAKRIQGIKTSPSSGAKPPSKKTTPKPNSPASQSPSALQKMVGNVMAKPRSPRASPRRWGGASSTIKAANTTVMIPNPTPRTSVTASIGRSVWAYA